MWKALVPFLMIFGLLSWPILIIYLSTSGFRKNRDSFVKWMEQVGSYLSPKNEFPGILRIDVRLSQRTIKLEITEPGIHGIGLKGSPPPGNVWLTIPISYSRRETLAPSSWSAVVRQRGPTSDASFVDAWKRDESLQRIATELFSSGVYRISTRRNTIVFEWPGPSDGVLEPRTFATRLMPIAADFATRFDLFVCDPSNGNTPKAVNSAHLLSGRESAG